MPHMTDRTNNGRRVTVEKAHGDTFIVRDVWFIQYRKPGMKTTDEVLFWQG